MTRRALAVVGIAAWMTLCDRFFHVATQTVVHYWPPFMGDQTFWVIPIFGLAALAIVGTAPRFAASEPRPLRFFGELLVMTAIYATSGFVGADHPTWVTAAFGLLFLARMAGTRARAQLLGVAVILAVSGPVFESLQWQLGMFRYTQPDIIGVPWWLIPFYANGAWAVRELGALLTSDYEAAESPSFSARSAY
ncbi:MAG TPA: hypothetical protein VM093_02105 [Aeromicrobium sp.]|nr:hypothetical protein [Aeromicrobium sp.]